MLLLILRLLGLRLSIFMTYVIIWAPFMNGRPPLPPMLLLAAPWLTFGYGYGYYCCYYY